MTPFERSLITRLRHVGIAVPNYRESVEFYRSMWGLIPVVEDADVTFFATPSHSEHYILRVRRDTEKRLDLISFATASPAAVDLIAERVVAAGHKIVAEPGVLDTPGGGYGARFFDVDGRLIEVSADVVGHPTRLLAPGESIPRKLSHVVVNSTDVLATKHFYETVLDFRLSDWLEDVMCFMRVRSDHHILAIAAGPHTSLNHISFDMGGVEEFLCGTGRLVRTGYTPLWGPGRHGAGDNTFSYFADATGNIVEYTTALEVIADEEQWIPRRFSTEPEQSDRWGTAGSPEVMIPAMKNDVDRGLWLPAPL